MTLKPIRGAPIDAPNPDFPAGKPAPLVIPASRFTRPTVEPAPPSLPQPTPSLLSMRRQGPIEIRGSGDGVLTFRCIPEIPAINRSSMTISITDEPTRSDAARAVGHLELSTDEAKAFLQALHDGHSPAVAVDSRSGFRVEFAIVDDGPGFVVNQPDRAGSSRRFNAGWSFDVKAMAAHLLADLGP
jgi:hypothetical protein